MSEIAPILEMYLDYADRFGFIDNGNLEIHNASEDAMTQFINVMGMYQGYNSIEINAIYDLAAVTLGRVHLCTYANFATPIGEDGLHSTPHMFNFFDYNNTHLFGAPPDNFAWYEPAMMLEVLTLIRRYHGIKKLTYNSGAYGCVPPYPQLVKQNLLRALYEDIFGWPLEDHDLIAHLLRKVVVGEEPQPGPTFGPLKTAISANKGYSYPYAT